MDHFLRLGADRRQVLQSTFDAVTHVWEEFDQARESEPVLSSDTLGLLRQELPSRGISHTAAVEDAIQVLDQSLAQSRPRFLAYIGSSGLEIGAIADFLAASYDINLAADARAASLLEVQTSSWLAEFIGFSNSYGLFTSGGTVSNITALAAARQRALPATRKSGNTVPVSVYCSSEAHYSNQRAVELLGMGTDAIRAISIDEHHRMRVNELEAAIVADIDAGITPVAIIASAGTTLTGAVDPLREIAAVAKKYGVWMHVDGAYGAPAAATSLAGPLFEGIDLADSVTVDAHKWLFVPKACSILLVKDVSALTATFGHDEAYMPHDGESVNAVDVTLEYSRPLRALKLWLGFKAHGADAFRAAIEHNLHLAQLTYDTASRNDSYRVLPSRPQLSVVPIQHIPDGMTDPQEISRHNAALCSAIEHDGRVFLSPAQIDGETWLRPCFTNFRTQSADVEALFTVIDELGTVVAASHN